MNKITKIVKSRMKRKAQMPEGQERWYELIYRGSVMLKASSQEDAERICKDDLIDEDILSGIVWDSSDLEDRGPVTGTEPPEVKPWNEPNIKLSMKKDTNKMKRTSKIKPSNLSWDACKEKLAKIWSSPDE